MQTCNGSCLLDSYLLQSYLEAEDDGSRADVSQCAQYVWDFMIGAGIIKAMRYFLLLAVAGFPMPAADLMEEIVCKVNGDIITRTELATGSQGVGGGSETTESERRAPG